MHVNEHNDDMERGTEVLSLKFPWAYPSDAAPDRASTLASCHADRLRGFEGVETKLSSTTTTREIIEDAIKRNQVSPYALGQRVSTLNSSPIQCGSIFDIDSPYMRENMGRVRVRGGLGEVIEEEKVANSEQDMTDWENGASFRYLFQQESAALIILSLETILYRFRTKTTRRSC